MLIWYLDNDGKKGIIKDIELNYYQALDEFERIKKEILVMKEFSLTPYVICDKIQSVIKKKEN